MPIFTLNQGKLTQINEIQFGLEKDIQKIVENNLQSLFNLEFVASEFPLNRLRVDTLGFDKESKSFVIIEYKKDRNFTVIDQGFTYLALLVNNKAEFILKYNESNKTHLRKDDIDWSQSRVIFISPVFATYQRKAIEFKDLPIELWEIKQYSNSIISLNQLTPSDDLMTFIWNDKKTLVDKFFNDFLSEFYNFYSKELNLRWLAFASGIPSREDFSSLKAVYYDSLWPFITNMFLTFSEQNKWVPKSFKRKYLTHQMFKENEFKRAIENLIKQFEISKYDAHSIILIGDNLESFSNFYGQICKEYLDPMFKELPQDKEINNIIKRIALRQKRIDSY
jgi:hypothetical protein